MIVDVGALTDTGRKRSHNEDRFLINDTEQLYMVADGLGGQAAGEVAAALATRVVERFVRCAHELDPQHWPHGRDPRLSPAANRLQNAILQAHSQLQMAGAAQPNWRGMGTTLTAALVEDERVTIGHVGDSRAYLWRNHLLEQLTRDHSLVARYVELGILTREQAQVHPLRHTLTCALGAVEHPTVDLVELQCEPGDRLLLCSDGLTKMVPEDEISEALAGINGHAAPAAASLIKRANECGGDDNITAVVLNLKPSPVEARCEPEPVVQT
jgi:protein phosphatase